jgi:hypothetical protein
MSPFCKRRELYMMAAYLHAVAHCDVVLLASHGGDLLVLRRWQPRKGRLEAYDIGC